MSKITTYKDWQEYKQNKLASKQADRLYKELTYLYKKKADGMEFHKLYKNFHNSYLYKKHSSLYCQVLSDAYMHTIK